MICIHNTVYTRLYIVYNLIVFKMYFFYNCINMFITNAINIINISCNIYFVMIYYSF